VSSKAMRQLRRFADIQTFPAPRRPMTRFSIRSETPKFGKCNVSLICRRFRSPMVRIESADGTFPSAAGLVALATLLDVMQTFRSRMSLKIYAPLQIFATKHGHYLRKMDKRGIGILSRASSEPVMCRRRAEEYFTARLKPLKRMITSSIQQSKQKFQLQETT
jgi:hypothetical protein